MRSSSKKFKNLIIVIDRSSEHPKTRGKKTKQKTRAFTIIAVLGIWDSESGKVKDIVYKKLRLKHGKKYRTNEKAAKMEKLKRALSGDPQLPLKKHISFLKIYTIDVIGRIHENHLPPGLFHDAQTWVEDCKFALGDKDIIQILRQKYPTLRIIDEKESTTTFKQQAHLMLLVDNIAYFARMARINHDWEFLRTLNINNLDKNEED